MATFLRVMDFKVATTVVNDNMSSASLKKSLPRRKENRNVKAKTGGSSNYYDIVKSVRELHGSFEKLPPHTFIAGRRRSMGAFRKHLLYHNSWGFHSFISCISNTFRATRSLQRVVGYRYIKKNTTNYKNADVISCD